MPKRFDRGKAIKIRRNDAGAMIVDGFPSRSGILVYVLPDGTIQKEFRSDEEVFSKESLDSFLGAPVTLKHPSVGMVDPMNAEKLSVGTVLGEAERDGNYTKSKFQILRKDAQDSVLAGKTVELSAGYTCDLIKQSGEYKGEKYDFVQKNIRINHVALVEKGRAGVSAALKLDSCDAIEQDENSDIIDSNDSQPNMEGKTVEKLINGIKFDVDDKVAQAIDAEKSAEKARLDAMSEKVSKLQAEADVAKKEAEETKQKLDSVDVDALVKERQETIEKCKKLDSQVDVSLGNKEMVRAVVEKIAKLDSGKKDDAYIQARFDMELEMISKKDSEKQDAMNAVSGLVSKNQQKTDEQEKPQNLLTHKLF
jgi:hypothetical protein